MLIKGRRISHLQDKITSALRLFFIIYLNEGKINLYKFGRTRNGPKEELIKIVQEIGANKCGFERLDTVYSANEEEGEEFRNTLRI